MVQPVEASVRCSLSAHLRPDAGPLASSTAGTWTTIRLIIRFRSCIKLIKTSCADKNAMKPWKKNRSLRDKDMLSPRDCPVAHPSSSATTSSICSCSDDQLVVFEHPRAARTRFSDLSSLVIASGGESKH